MFLIDAELGKSTKKQERQNLEKPEKSVDLASSKSSYSKY